ncbi:MAG: hypothetical protein WBQ44_09890 [Rhodococcus sp. (in: high G+C Gram-positive bacteria)]
MSGERYRAAISRTVADELDVTPTPAGRCAAAEQSVDAVLVTLAVDDR